VDEIQTTSTTAAGPGVELDHRSIGLGHVIFFVVAAAAPLTAVVGASPAAFAFGNGAGVPGAFVLAGLLYLLFSAGFTAMSHHVGGAGGFYVYLAQGIGRPFGAAGALMMLVTYNAAQFAIYAIFGVFFSAAVASFGLVLPWWICTFGAIVAVLLCGRRSIAFSGNLLGLCMIGEVLILLLLDLAIVVHGGGPEGLSLSTFSIANTFAPGLGAALVFVVGSFTGFEATVIFSEEARDPRRTIPRATYAAVILITSFYAFSTWAIAQYYGPSHIHAAAAGNISGLFFDAARALLGGWAVAIMRTLLVVSLFACVLSLHNAINRYLFAMGRDRTAPSVCAKLHPRHRSPYVAGQIQALISIVVLGALAALRLDPYGVIFSWLSVIGVLGILMVQLMVCIAVLLFFRQRPHGEPFWRTTLCPALAFLGLSMLIYLVIRNMPLLAGADNALLQAFPWMMMAVGCAGIGQALWLRRRHPDIYLRLGRNFD